MDPCKLVFLLLFAAIPSLRASSSKDYRSNWYYIDCGASNETQVIEDGIRRIWQTDTDFTKSGENKLLPAKNNEMELNTLRFFPKGKRNCYKLPFLSANEKFMFRAGFYYGNYDGLNKPPSFCLEIDGKIWANVTTSLSEEAVYYELIYVTKGLDASVCLVRTVDDEVPFISSLQATITYNSYMLMDSNTALYLHSRINYGANQSVEQTIGFFEERYIREWKSKEMSNYLNIHQGFIPDGSLLAENDPPWPVMAYAIQAQNVTDSIYLSVDFSPRTSVQAYFVLYFMDPILRFPPENGSFEIYIDNRIMAFVDVLDLGSNEDQSRVVSLFPVPVNGSANVTISPVEGSMMAPILNAMEVFSSIDVSKAGHLFGLSAVLLVIMLHLLCVLMF